MGKLTYHEERLIERLPGRRFKREAALPDTKDCARGGGFMFFTKDGRRLPPKTCVNLIERGHARPLSDGLFGDDSSQSFEIVADA